MADAFALFAGDDYYPGGGWEDYVGTFATVETAQAAARVNEFGWAHVVDLGRGVIVSHRERLGEWKAGREYDD